MPDLWKNARRLPYFFTWDEEGAIPRRWVVCPQCALEYVNDHKLSPHYTTLTSVMCCRCGIVLGPINKAEMEEV